MKEYKVLDSIWFGGTIGLVKVQTEYDGIQCYIGTGKGLSQSQDEQHIAAWGQCVNPGIFVEFFNNERFQ